MQLSVATTPTEPNLAALLLGGIASTTPGQPAPAAGGNAAPFAQLFPDLASGAPVADALGSAGIISEANGSATAPLVAPGASGTSGETARTISAEIFPSLLVGSFARASFAGPQPTAPATTVGETKKSFRAESGATALGRRGAHHRLATTGKSDEPAQPSVAADVAPTMSSPTVAALTPDAGKDSVALSVEPEKFDHDGEEGRSVPANDASVGVAPMVADWSIVSGNIYAAKNSDAPAVAPRSGTALSFSAIAPATNLRPRPATASPIAVDSPTDTEEILPSVLPTESPATSLAPGAPRTETPVVAVPTPIAPPPAAAATATPVATDSVGSQSPAPVATELPQLFSANDASTQNFVEPIITAPGAVTRASTRGEKFAARDEKNSGEKISARTLPPKTFLNAEEKRVTSREPDLGIGVAKSTPAMSAPNFSNRSAPVAASAHAASAAVAMAPAESVTRAASVLASDAPTAAQRAVEAVLNVAERFSAGDRHTVNLHFSVGGADLAVRVELRADEVRTTFRTDSAELRTALAHEWQGVNADSADRPLRLAAPVITSNSSDASGGLAAFTGDSASRQRDSGAQRAAEEVFGSIASRVRSAAQTATSAAEEIISPATRLAALPTALHLHTLA